MTNEKFYQISEFKGVELVTVTRKQLLVSDNALARYMPPKPCLIPKLCMAATITGEADKRPVTAVINDRTAYVNIPILVFPLNAHFVIEDGILVPNFGGETSIQIALKWNVPEFMNVNLMVVIDSVSLTATAQVLYAIDSSHKTWRLPTSNTYENGSLCTGAYDNSGNSLIEVAIKAHAQFRNSAWQSDLSNRGGSHGMTNAKQMFRFKPKEKEGFSQLPVNLSSPERNWSTLCTSFANETLVKGMIL